MNIKIKWSLYLLVFGMLFFGSSFEVKTSGPMVGKWKLKKLIFFYGGEGYIGLLPQKIITEQFGDSLIIQRGDSSKIQNLLNREVYVNAKLLPYKTKGGRSKTGHSMLIGGSHDLMLKTYLSFSEHPKDLEYSVSESWQVDSIGNTLSIRKTSIEVYGKINTYEVQGIYEKE